MKFARDYKEALLRDQYPSQWVESAISYKKLKKCIKRVQEELSSLGLDNATLERLWQHGSLPIANGSGNHQDVGMHYALQNDDHLKFTPRLTIALDPRDGSPMDAWLSPETRRFLRTYGTAQPSSSVLSSTVPHEEEHRSSDMDGSVSTESTESSGLLDMNEIETVEISLTSDSEFFQILRQELSALEQIQKSEQTQLVQEIHNLGSELRHVKEGRTKRGSKDNKRSKAELEVWREIFRLYSQAEVFFSSHELDAGQRNSSQAQQQLVIFQKNVAAQKDKQLVFSREGAEALERFMHINLNLLKLMKYSEINKTALTKIMKKFDKQTSLHARDGVLQQLNNTSFIAQDLAKATCFTISDELLKIIPQLDDYLCPICFSISWKPIRLRCGHVFCIRCLIVMQRANQDNCPLCREPVVMQASSDNMDEKLMSFLKENFKDEIKSKQRENEHAAGVDQFGENYSGTHRCLVM